MTPVELVVGLNEPPVGLILQVTPAVSLVVAASERVCVTVRLARLGEMETVILEELMVKVKDEDCVLTGLLESATLKVSGELETDCVGVPVIAPVEIFKDNPAGRVPLLMDQVYGAMPPVDERVAL